MGFCKHENGVLKIRTKTLNCFCSRNISYVCVLFSIFPAKTKTFGVKTEYNTRRNVIFSSVSPYLSHSLFKISLCKQCHLQSMSCNLVPTGIEMENFSIRRRRWYWWKWNRLSEFFIGNNIKIDGTFYRPFPSVTEISRFFLNIGLKFSGIIETFCFFR
jgi:hypothetical protein